LRAHQPRHRNGSAAASRERTCGRVSTPISHRRFVPQLVHRKHPILLEVEECVVAVQSAERLACFSIA
jgi:hypothetical protein